MSALGGRSELSISWFSDIMGGESDGDVAKCEKWLLAMQLGNARGIGLWPSHHVREMFGKPTRTPKLRYQHSLIYRLTWHGMDGSGQVGGAALVRLNHLTAWTIVFVYVVSPRMLCAHVEH